MADELFRPAVAATDLTWRGVLVAPAGATVQARTVIGGVRVGKDNSDE